MLNALGPLRWPFIAGSAALMILGVIWTTWDRGPYPDEVGLGLLIGALASIVLYAVLRALAKPPGTSWPQ